MDAITSLERRDVSRFPILAEQVRCSSGCTFIPGGRMIAFSPRARPATAKIAEIDDPVLALLHLLAKQGNVLPFCKDLAAMLSGDWSPRKVAMALRRLHRFGQIRVVEFASAGNDEDGAPRGVRILGTGAVLRTRNLPSWVTL